MVMPPLLRLHASQQNQTPTEPVAASVCMLGKHECGSYASMQLTAGFVYLDRACKHGDMGPVLIACIIQKLVFKNECPCLP